MEMDFTGKKCSGPVRGDPSDSSRPSSSSAVRFSRRRPRNRPNGQRKRTATGRVAPVRGRPEIRRTAGGVVRRGPRRARLSRAEGVQPDRRVRAGERGEHGAERGPHVVRPAGGRVRRADQPDRRRRVQVVGRGRAEHPVRRVHPTEDLLHGQVVRQGQSGAGAETSRFLQAADHVGRRSERGGQVRGQVPAGQGPDRGRKAEPGDVQPDGEDHSARESFLQEIATAPDAAHDCRGATAQETGIRHRPVPVVLHGSVGQGSENVRGEDESHLDPPEQGRAGEPKAAGKHRGAHRDAVQRGRETFRARHQLRRQKRLQDARARETRVQLRRPAVRHSDGQADQVRPFEKGQTRCRREIGRFQKGREGPDEINNEVSVAVGLLPEQRRATGERGCRERAAGQRGRDDRSGGERREETGAEDERRRERDDGQEDDTRVFRSEILRARVVIVVASVDWILFYVVSIIIILENK